MRRHHELLLAAAAGLPLLLLLAALVQHPAFGAQAQLSASWNEENIGRLLLQAVSLLAGQKYEPEELSARWREWALSDDSNANIIQATRQQIIERSGFAYENHYVTSDDGYITQLIRLVNPLAERAQLKGPPVMLLQGGISDSTIWIWGSAIQHHPERFPRVQGRDGPISSWNRSLAFTLANNGYDVWLVGSRGANADNRGHVKFQRRSSPFNRGDRRPQAEGNRTSPRRPAATNGSALGESDFGRRDLLERLRYWDFSMDELAQLELPRQIERVLELTGAQNVSLVPVSFSGTYFPMTFAAKPEYLARLHTVVAVAPIVNHRGTNLLYHTFARTVCKFVAVELGNLIANELIFADPLRQPLGRLFKSRQLRYLLLKAISIALQGPSSMYQTFLEEAVYGNIFLPTSWKEIKHFCQVVTAGRLQWYDHGPTRNRQLYGGSPRPPAYDTGPIDFGTWMMVSAENDVLAPASSIRDFISYSHTPPAQHVRVPHYNHQDLIAGFDLDVRVNLPILNFLERCHLPASNWAAAAAA